MSPEQWQHKCLNWQSINRGVTRAEPFRILGDAGNPGKIVKCIPTGDFYVLEDGKLTRVEDPTTIQKLRTKKW